MKDWNAGFEAIAQMVLEQKKIMDSLEAENRELRRELADLRRGVGVCVVIEGKAISLAIETIPLAPVTQEITSTSSLSDKGAKDPGQSGEKRLEKTPLANPYTI